MEHAENIDKHLVNHQEAEGDAQRIGNQIRIERELASGAVNVGRKDDREGDELGDEVAEKELELPKKAAPDHECANPHFQDRMQYPERVIKKLESLAHPLPSPTRIVPRDDHHPQASKTAGSTFLQHYLGLCRTKASGFHLGVQCTPVIQS